MVNILQDLEETQWQVIKRILNLQEKKLQIHSPAGLTIYAIVNKLVELQDIEDAVV